MAEGLVNRALSWLKGDGDDDGAGRTVMLPVDKIDPNPYQPRQHFSEAEMAELAESIKGVGVLQPVVVRATGERYQLIMGERRLRASVLAGREHIPAIVRHADEEEAALLALIENIQRSDLSFWEEAEAYRRILDQPGATQARLAAALGRTQSTIANKVRLLRLPEEIQERARLAGLSERHVRALLRLESVEDQHDAIAAIMAGSLSARETDELINEMAKAGEEPEGDKRQVKGGLRMIRDVRIVLNTFEQGINALRQAGLDAMMETREEGRDLFVTIRIPRARQE